MTAKRTATAMKRQSNGMSFIELAAEALQTLSTAPVGTKAAYAAGTFPFALALVHFWADMSRNAYAAERCFSHSLLLALLFLWMKVWQTVFAAGLGAHIRGKPASPWTRQRLRRMIATQLSIQPYGLVAIPLALLALAPFPLVYSFYQNVTLIGDGTESDPRRVGQRAWKQAREWPVQNALLMWLYCPWVFALGMLGAFGTMWFVVAANPDLGAMQGMIWFILAYIVIMTVVLPIAPVGCILAWNIAATVLLIPYLLQSVLGIQTGFTLGGIHTMLNTTFLMVVFMLTYLVLDPLAKAAYALRCFYGESRQSGEDLLVELHAIQSSSQTAARGEAGV